jgi:FkbM family methyltransferase
MPLPDLTRLASYLGLGRLGELEALAQRAQGKGWGAGTVANEAAAVRQLLGDAADGPLMVLDVGANVGAWTLQALQVLPRAHIHALEPSARAHAALSAAVLGETRVSVHQVALGASDGAAVLYADVPGSGLASLTRRRLDHLGIEFSHEESVPLRTLESWSLSAGAEDVDVLKLDVEGHELDVLRGAGGVLGRVRVIQWEFGGCNIDTRSFFQDFWYLLIEAGFRICRLGPAGLSVVARYSERDETFSTTNYFAHR